jgi:MazG family protein
MIAHVAKAAGRSCEELIFMSQFPETERLIGVVRRLRKECPWDRKQTHRSLTRYLVEEAFEAVEALRSRNSDAMREELGDVLLQVVLHAAIAEETGRFDIEAIAKGIADKMIRRHPHVFAPATVDRSAKGLSRRWTELKQKEKPKRGLLDGIPKALPGLLLAQRYGEIAASVDFDWDNARQVLAKLREELDELARAARTTRKAAIEEELGDLLFTAANLARHYRLDADEAARKAARKFGERFRRMEAEAKRRGTTFAELPRKEKEALWEMAKGNGGATSCPRPRRRKRSPSATIRS